MSWLDCAWLAVAGITKWIHKWKHNGWKVGSGKPVINREELEELDEELHGINVDWVCI